MKNTKRPVVPAINIKTARRFTHGGVHVYHVPHTNHTNRGAIVLFAEYYGAVRCGAVRVLAFENRAVRCVTYGVWFLYFHTVESDAVSRLNGMVRNDAVRKIRVTTPHTERRAVATCFVLLAPYLGLFARVQRCGSVRILNFKNRTWRCCCTFFMIDS